MKNMQKALIGMTAAMMLAGTAIGPAVYAGEVSQTVDAAVEVAAETEEETKDSAFTSADGVFSIQIPQDDDNWKMIDDLNYRFAISDGTDLITVEHIANGDLLPAVELANEQYAEIYQTFCSTKNEVFVITGRITNLDEAQNVKDAVNSFKVLKYDTIRKKEAAQPAQQPAPQNENELIADGKIFTGNHMNLYDGHGNIVTLSELNQGGWANEATGEIFNRGPAGGNFWYGDRGTTLAAEFQGGYAGINYDENEQGGYAGINYDENEQGGYAGINYDENEQGGYAGINYDENEQGGYAGANYYENEQDDAND